MKISLQNRFMLTIIPFALVSIVVSGFTWSKLQDGASSLGIEDAMELKETATLSRLYVTEMSDGLKGFVLDPSNEKEAEKKKRADEMLSQLLARMKEKSTNAEIRRLLAEMADFDEKKLNPAENKVISLIKEGQFEKARKSFTSEYTPLRISYDDLSSALSAATANFATLQIRGVNADMRKMAWEIPVGIFFGLVLTVALISFFARGVSSKVGTIASDLMASGDQTLTASEQLSGASQSLSSGATESASSLEETVAALEELSSTVKLNSDNAGQAASLSMSASLAAVSGEEQIRNLIQSVNEIAQSSKKIEEIINVIDDISFQTNLLALNAAVEAARAGEQGKGFAVVADAVRTLAQRSTAAAKDISSLIKDSVEKSARGASMADKSGAALQDIVSSIKKVSELNSEIASAGQEQSRGIAQISKAMNELDQATQKNAAMAEEVAASSEQLSAQATRMLESVNELRGAVTGDSEDHSSHGGHGQKLSATLG